MGRHEVFTIFNFPTADSRKFLREAEEVFSVIFTVNIYFGYVFSVQTYMKLLDNNIASQSREFEEICLSIENKTAPHLLFDFSFQNTSKVQTTEPNSIPILYRCSAIR